MKNYDKLIDEIQVIRTKNNRAWMDILRIAFKNSPKKAGMLMKEITDNDKKISKLSGKLAKEAKNEN